jgi:hypothetical protein
MFILKNMCGICLLLNFACFLILMSSSGSVNTCVSHVHQLVVKKRKERKMFTLILYKFDKLTCTKDLRGIKQANFNSKPKLKRKSTVSQI